jgi:hypothetical protein
MEKIKEKETVIKAENESECREKIRARRKKERERKKERKKEEKKMKETTKIECDVDKKDFNKGNVQYNKKKKVFFKNNKPSLPIPLYSIQNHSSDFVSSFSSTSVPSTNIPFLPISVPSILTILQTFVHSLIPLPFFGSSYNRSLFFRRVKKFLQMTRKESLPLTELVRNMKV